jgi:pre-mRNA 3'-end-processing factor FIP1
MDEEEDDFYDPVDAVPTTQSQNAPQNAAQEDSYMENDEDEFEEEEDDDVRIFSSHR